MYQSIDDEPQDKAVQPAWVTPVAVAGLFLMAVAGAAIWIDGTVQSGTSDPVTPEPEARQAYLRALGETQPALRRARLTDFLNQYSQDPRSNAAQAQLSVLDAAADTDWMDVLTIAQDPTQELEMRRTAVMNYRENWGRYLGARDEEIDALLTEIEATPDTGDVPDRSLPDIRRDYPGVPDDRLVGAPEDTRPPVIYRPSPLPRRTQIDEGVVVSPRVVRNVTPRYPRRALRRGIEGVVTLSLNIDADGRVAMVELVNVDADRYADDFVKAAERAALRTRFRPKTVGGQPVPVSGVQKRYRFEAD